MYDKDSKIPYRNGDDLVFAGAAQQQRYQHRHRIDRRNITRSGAGMAKVWNSAIPGMKANAQSTRNSTEPCSPW